MIANKMATYQTTQSSQIAKLPPQSIEAEQSLLGSLMLDKNAVTKVADFLRPADFYRKSHQNIYEAVLHLYEKGESIDILTVSAYLKERNFLTESGGKTYLTQLINMVPTASHSLPYAKIVHRKKILRDLIEAAHGINILGYTESQDVDLLLDEAEKKIFTISQRFLKQEFLHIKPALEEAFERIDKLHKKERALRGLATGFIDLDSLLAGLQRSDLIVLAARPGIGKSALATDIARSIAINEKKSVGIFTLEMSKEQVVDRFLAAESGVDLRRIRTGELSYKGEDNDFTRLQNAIGRLSEAPIFIDDTPSANVLQMRAMSRRLQTKHDLGLIIVDYLQLMEPRTISDSMVQQVTEISRSLKGLARELNVPVLAVSQLSRAVEQRSPQIPRLSDLRESGSIEQDADVVLLIYREDRERPNTERKNIIDLIIAKHRNGPLGKVELYFDERIVSFRNLERMHSE